MRAFALLVAMVLTGCGADLVAAPPTSSSSGAGGHGGSPTTAAPGGAGGSSSTTSASGGAGGSAPAWCATPIAGGAPTGTGFAAAWARSVGEGQPDWLAGPFDVAADPAGDAVVIGSFVDTFDLGTGAALSTANAGTDGYVAALSPAGAPLWLSEAPSMPEQVVAADGVLWVMSAIADFTLTRYDPAGHATWTWPVQPYDMRFAMAPDGAGGLWAADAFVGEPFDYGSGTIPAGGGAGTDVALLHFDGAGAVASAISLGALIWPAPPAAPHLVELGGMAPAPGGGVLLLVHDADDAGGSSLSLLRLDASASPLWTLHLGAVSDDADPRLLADAQGDALILVHGGAYGPADVGCGPIEFSDAGLVYVGADGAPRWWRTFANVAVAGGGFRANGDIVLAGRQTGPTDLGGGALPWPAGSTRRALALALSPGGVHLASRSFGDGAAEVLHGAVAPGGDLLVAGAYTGALDLGLASGPLPAVTTRTGFVARLAP